MPQLKLITCSFAGSALVCVCLFSVCTLSSSNSVRASRNAGQSAAVGLGVASEARSIHSRPELPSRRRLW